MPLIRVREGDKVYEFDPDKQRKNNFLDLLSQKLPLLTRGQRVWLAQQAVKMKGIKITEDTEGGEL